MSEEKQIEEIAGILLRMDNCENYDDIECIKVCNKCYATQIYNAGYRKQEWISVDERLPEESGVYVAYTDNGNSITLDYSAKHKLFNSFDSYSRDVAEGFAIPVTHWMPLPEAPKMKGGAE